MAEIKWIKITTNMFDDEKIKLIDAMPERDTIHYIWIRLLVQAGKTNAHGYIFLNENVPYTDEMLATIFNRPLNSVRLALQTLSNFGMIQVQEDKLIQIVNWEKHQNVEGMDKVREQNRLRKQKQRAKKKQLTDSCPIDEEEVSRDSNVTVTEQKKIEKKIKNKKEDIDIDEDKDINKNHHHNYNNFSDIAIKLEKCGFGISSPNIVSKLAADVEIYGLEWVFEAIEVSDAKGVHNYSFVKTILENWKNKGKWDETKNKKEEVKSNGASNELEKQGIGLKF